MNLLVTGGAGFIGTNFLHQVIDRAEVKRLVNLDCLTYAGRGRNLADLEDNRRYRFLRLDIATDAAARWIQRERPDAIVILAGYPQDQAEAEEFPGLMTE